MKKFQGFPPKPHMNFWSYPKDLNGYWHQLSGSEQKVLDYILRHTWGFDKDKDEISLTQLETGIKNFDKGTGLSRPTVISAISGLIEKGFVEKKEGKHANCYELVKNFNYPNKKSLPFASKETLHTIENNTIKNTNNCKFSLEEKIQLMKKSSKRYMQIIALYWKFKNFTIENKKQYDSLLKRDLKAASNLVGFSNERILEIMTWLEDENTFKWSLETVFKYMCENLSGIKSIIR